MNFNFPEVLAYSEVERRRKSWKTKAGLVKNISSALANFKSESAI